MSYWLGTTGSSLCQYPWAGQWKVGSAACSKPLWVKNTSDWIEPGNGTARTITVTVNGSEKTVNANEAFVEGVQRLASEAGMSSFKVLIGGVEVGRSNAPATFGQAEDDIEIVPYQKAGTGA